MGIVSTGRSRVFDSYYVEVWTDERSVTRGTDRHSLLAALERTASTLLICGFELQVAGLSMDFYESGLSFNSGCGYRGEPPVRVHMMDRL